MTSCGSPAADLHLYATFHLSQREALGAVGAKPEIFKFAFCFHLSGMEAKESAPIKAH
jgi:hypothetical protein